MNSEVRSKSLTRYRGEFAASSLQMSERFNEFEKASKFLLTKVGITTNSLQIPIHLGFNSLIHQNACTYTVYSAFQSDRP